MTTRSPIVLVLVWLWSVGASIENTTVRKCCPPGRIFSDLPNVSCVPVPVGAMELYSVDYDGVAVHRNGIPNCKEIKDVATTPLYVLNDTDFLQMPVCLEILHMQSTNESDPTIVVHCRSDKDKDELYEASNASLPRLLNVRRCCQKYTIFDVATRTCVPLSDVIDDGNYSDTSEFTSFVSNVTNTVDFFRVSRGLPNCTPGAMVTYKVGPEDIRYKDGTLQVMLPSSANSWNEWFPITEENGCLELTKDSQIKRQLAVRVCRNLEFCESNSCVRKCCPENGLYALYGRKYGCDVTDPAKASSGFYRTVSNLTSGTWEDTGNGLLVGSVCKKGRYMLKAFEIQNLTQTGYLQQVVESPPHPHSDYCLEMLNETVIAVMCFPDEAYDEEVNKVKITITSILTIVSCVFLLLTLLVYICLPTLQNLHGKTLMCHSASLLMSYICLAIMPWVTPFRSPENSIATTYCAALGYLMFFFFLSAFSWLNIMCFDIWRTFGSLRGNFGRGRSHGKRFLLYCLYAWGLALLITGFAILTDQMHLLPTNFTPYFGTTKCWFTTQPWMYGELIFFRGPVAIQLISNVVFFILTAEHCSKVKAEIRRVADPSDPRSKRFHADKTKLVMNVKLFIVMGITWIAEILSSLMNQYTSVSWKEAVFYGSDAVNCLQGVLIFILFVLKPRVYQALKKRLGFDQTKKNSSQGTSTLQDPFKVKKSASNSTLTSSCAISVAP
ncbi:G-protein coupled receptor Mth2-like isoform X1 [Hylaeus volcanicus]|uniref:G-protein coupled receptor Mth2-like isoform X1 n=2 Tax=Hylaeus volcanicus TaxID=313075 RepID=UPI0023B7AE21|nr:G-protein coupled receptor Mth2-like isoform X1 [Hylaeus volcanicus]XP_053978079.1 G-protein coupled receptor Mth2-like isoform X1 [Hylaeus volcanicus]